MNYSDRSSHEPAERIKRPVTNIVFFVKLVLVVIPTILVGVNPVPQTAPWRFGGPPVEAIFFNCTMIGLAIGLSISVIRSHSNFILRSISIFCLILNVWFAWSLLKAY